MDLVDVGAIFRRAAAMKSVSRFLHGPFRNTLKVATEEALASMDPARQLRGCKSVLVLAPECFYTVLQVDDKSHVTS